MRFFKRINSLFFKVIFVISLILIFAFSFNVMWNTALHEVTMEKLTREKAKIIAGFIEKDIIRAISMGKHFEMHGILKSFLVDNDIRKIVILSMDGTIKASTQEKELKKNIGDAGFYLKNPYLIREEIVPLKNEGRERQRVYYFNAPILNSSGCFKCHGREKKVIGILSVSGFLKEMDTMVSAIKIHSIILAIASIASLSLIIGLLYRRFINVPIRKLTETMKKAEMGDLNARVNIKGRDEMGTLAADLNVMIEKLNLTRQEAEQYHLELVQRADRMASIGELASGIAHEIRNPLAGIQGAIQILTDALPREDSRRGVTDEIQKKIYKMESLVKALLNYAKPAPRNYLPTDINQLLEKSLSFFVTQQGSRDDIIIEKFLFSPLPMIMIDQNSMEQAFLNIILNAHSAMPKGGTLRIFTSLLNQKEDAKEEGAPIVRIVFEDTGIGIQEENLPRVFNPFFSTRSDGTGLGLSTTKSIVEQHGGDIALESRVNAGTKVIITLPVTREKTL